MYCKYNTQENNIYESNSQYFYYKNRKREK